MDMIKDQILHIQYALERVIQTDTTSDYLKSVCQEGLTMLKSLEFKVEMILKEGSHYGNQLQSDSRNEKPDSGVTDSDEKEETCEKT